jgi:PAS domain S-box-containing protein
VAGTLAGGDALSRWLAGDGQAALDGITGEALDVIGVIDRDLVVRYLNWTVPGLTRESVVGNSVLDLVPPNYRDIARDTYTRVLRTGTGARFETIYAEGEDLLIWDVRVGPIRFEGEVIGLIVITNNVTEQRRDQADRDRFFSLSLDLLIVVSPNGQIKRINPAFGEALGFELSDLIGRPFIDLVHPDDRVLTRDTFAAVLSGARVVDFENRYVRSDGGHRVLSWRATVDPVTKSVYAVARDITAHRTIEAQLRQAQKMEAVGQLAGGVAHDFNNLLSAILGNAELAKADIPPGSKPAELLGEIETAASRAANLTNQLLSFSRRQPFRPLAVDLNGLIHDLMKMLRRLLPENITIDLSPGRDLAPVHADPTQLEQVVVNLCVNARDAMSRGGRLTIQTENASVDDRFREALPWAKPGGFVLLSVTDTGAGMTPEVRERAFEPFFTTKGSRHGTGLGLSTVYGIVQQHGGIIQVSSEPGRGTTFKVFLPADSGRATNVDDKTERPPPRGQETILLAEDEERVRKVVVHILERAGYRAIATSDGREAIRFLREYDEAVHLVLLDVVMPDLGGPETWEQMRALRPDLRVLFTSGYADDSVLALLPPDAEVIGKPFRTEDLLRRVRRKLDEDR